MSSEIPWGYCQCGCGAPTHIATLTCRSRGWVKGEPYKFLAGHGKLPDHSRYRVDDETGCWIWEGCILNDGYGSLRYKKKHWRAHRFFYDREVGSIPGGYTLHHRCHTRACVNPEHMDVVRRDDHSGALGHGKLTREDVREIRVLSASGEQMKTIAATFGVSPGHISEIVARKKWAKA